MAHRTHRRRSSPAPRLALEGLETRCLLSGSGSQLPPGETLDAALGIDAQGVHNSAYPVGFLNVPLVVGAYDWATAAGAIGTGPAGAADVNWYGFQLSTTARVQITAFSREIGSPLVSTVSLYNNDPYDPFNPIDPYTPTGHRLIAQGDGADDGGEGTVGQLLGPGTYWVAVSGSPNDNFHPFLADSGLYGSTGAYTLAIRTTASGITATGPVVLESTPASGAILSGSPFVLRFDLNQAVNPHTTVAQLQYLGTNGTSIPRTVTLDAPAFQTGANELLLTPRAPLQPGYYRVTLHGDGGNGTNLILNFRIDGIDGNTGPDAQAADTLDTALNLGNVTHGQLVQVSGAIGIDPTDAIPYDQGAVEIYHFRISGPGTYALDAEVFAGRIGSPLDAALTLFKAVLNPDGTVTTKPLLIGSNDNTLNDSVATDGEVPLYTDPALFVSLTAGDYYIAVSSGENINTADGVNPQGSGGFDPLVSHSGNTAAGYNVGAYTMELLVQPAAPAPHVVAVSADSSRGGPLTTIQVRFDRPVNLTSLAYAAYSQSLQQTGLPNGALAAATLVDSQGHYTPLRLQSYDDATNTATFLLLDGVPNGTYTLRLSGLGGQGITSFGGTPLAGNDPATGDFLAQIVVTGSRPDTLNWQQEGGHNSPAHAQSMGVLFPVELSQGVTITSDGTQDAPSATQDDYRISLLQTRLYSFTFSADSVPGGATVSIFDATGQLMASYTDDPNNPPLPIQLSAGTYRVEISWSGAPAAYALDISYSGSADNPTPLVIGPGPALRVRLLTSNSDSSGSSTVVNTGGTGGVSPGASSTVFLPVAGLINLPSSSLLAQGLSPLSGVVAPGSDGSLAGGNLLAVRGTMTPGTDTALLGLLIATQPAIDTPTDPTSTGPTPGGASGQAALAAPTLDTVLRVLDTFFEYWNLYSTPAPQTPAPVAPTPAPTPDAGDGDDGGLGAVPQGDGTRDEAGEWQWGWACAIAAGAFLAPQIRHRKRAHGGTRRIPIVDATPPGPR